MAIALRHIAKSFGTHSVFRDLTLNIEAGALHGVIGPNGAGKTTLFRIMLGLLPPDEGTLTWQNQPWDRHPPRLAYVPEERGLYPFMSVRQHLQWFGRLWGLSPTVAQERALFWLDRLALTPYAATAALDLSKGNARKLQLALSLLVPPDLLILDEPFDGMDPTNVHLIQNVLQTLHQEGMTIILSSHNLDFLETFCTSVTLLRQGHVMVHGTQDMVRQSLSWWRLVIRFQTPDAARRLAAWQVDGVTALAQDDLYTAIYQVTPQALASVQLDAFASYGPIAAIHLEPPSLADVYWHFTASADKGEPG